MRWRLPITISLVLLSTLAFSPMGGAAPPPPEAIATLRPGAISLRWESKEINGEKIWLHLSVVPKGRHPNNPIEPALAKAPIKREDITEGPVLKESPFTLDIFATGKNGKLTRLHTLTYLDEGDISGITLKWLQPAQKQGPLLLIEGGYTHWKWWRVLGFPNGVRDKKQFDQYFLWGGEGDIYVTQRFDKTDKRGYLVVEETSANESHKERTYRYTWNGEQFTDQEANYFLIAATTKTRAEAEEFVKKHGFGDQVTVLPTSRYAKLAPGLFAVVLGRYHTQKEANEESAFWKKNGTDCYAKRAY
jgi:hypothetical protein